MPGQMKKSHVFGTKSMPMKKTRSSKKPNLASSMSMDKLCNLMQSIPPVATKLCGETHSGVLPTQAKITSVSLAKDTTELSSPPVPAQATEIASIHRIYVDLSPEVGKRAPFECTSAATSMITKPKTDGLNISDGGSTYSSRGAGTPPSFPPNPLAVTTKLPGSDTDVVIPERTFPASLSRSNTVFGFRDLAILRPARLYSADQEPTGSRVPYATDESLSQAHARRSFLRKPVANNATPQPVKPGVAIQRLGGSRIFDSLFPTYPRTVPTTPNAVLTTALSTAHVASKVETVLGVNSQTQGDADNLPSRANRQTPTPDLEALLYNRDHHPLDTPLQQAGNRTDPYFYREPLLRIDDGFFDEEEEVTGELIPTYHSRLARLPTLETALENDIHTDAVSKVVAAGKTEVRTTDTNWQLTDEDFGDTTELSVSDAADANQNEAVTFSDEVAALTAPVLQSLADIKSSLSLSHNNMKIKPIVNPKMCIVADSAASTSSTTLGSDGHSLSRTMSDSSAASTTSRNFAGPALSKAALAFQMSNTFLGSTSFSDLLNHHPSPPSFDPSNTFTQLILARAFILCVAAEHHDSLLFSPNIILPGVTLITEADVEKAMEFEVQRRAKLGGVSLFQFLRIVEWENAHAGVEGVWEAWRKAAAKEQGCEGGAWGYF